MTKEFIKVNVYVQKLKYEYVHSKEERIAFASKDYDEMLKCKSNKDVFRTKSTVSSLELDKEFVLKLADIINVQSFKDGKNKILQDYSQLYLRTGGYLIVKGTVDSFKDLLNKKK